MVDQIPGHYAIVELKDVPADFLDLNRWQQKVGSPFHPKRLTGIAISRYAASLCLEKYNIIKSPYDININEGKWDLPFHISISHTENFAICLICKLDEVKNIGIDIELKNRSLTDEMIQKIQTRSMDSSLSPLQVWTYLEAAFKTIPKDKTPIKHPLQIYVDKKHFYFDQNEGARGQLLKIDHPLLEIALATIT